MKLLLSVIALAFATPALAQNASADQHAGHAHQAPQPTPPAPIACTAEHAAMGHCKLSPRPAAPTGQQAGQGHDDDCCKKDANGKMACCEKMRAAGKDRCGEDGKPPVNPQSDHSGH